MHFIKFRFLLVASPGIDTDFDSTSINETSEWSFLCLSEHFPITGILELLYVDNYMFTGQRLGFQIVKGITFH